MRFPTIIALAGLVLAPCAHAEQGNQSASQEQQDKEFQTKLRALHWVVGPSQVQVAGNSSLQVPAGYLFLDNTETAKFEELTQNLSSGKEVMVAPRSLKWMAYLDFSDEGMVKDDDKIDADAILSSLKSGTEEENEERRSRGWDTWSVTGWAMRPAYNSTTKRLEWAILATNSAGEQGINFFTKILGRRGVTSVQLVASAADEPAAVPQLDQVLTGYTFNSGERYADWRPGDKVATYGLTGLIVGGAVAAAAKTGLLKGLWKFVVAGFVAAWKIIAAAFVAALAWLRSVFSRKKTGPAGPV